MPGDDPWDTSADPQPSTPRPDPTDRPGRAPRAPRSPQRPARAPRSPTAAAAPPPNATTTDTQPADDDWPTPKSLVRYADPIPTDALGDVLGPMVEAVAHTYQVPSDVAVTMALPLITTAAAGRWNVRVRPGWTETLVLSGLTILGSSGGKSPVLKRLKAPLDAYELTAQHQARETYARSKAAHEELKDRVEKYRVEIKNTPDAKKIPGSHQAAQHEQLRETYLQAAADLEAHEITMPPRWTCDDITPEALAKVMYEQGGAIGIVSDEAGIFATLGGRYNQGTANLDVVLKGYSGSRIQIDRKSNVGPPIAIDSPALSVSVAVQPGLMRRLGDKDEFRESGLLGRFLQVMPESIMGSRIMDTDDVPEHIESYYATCLEDLARTAQGLRERDERRDIALDEPAFAILQRYRVRMEPEFAEGGELEHIRDFGGKLAGNAVRIAAALTLLEDAEATTVDGDRMRDALRIATGYVDHAHVAFGSLSGADPATPHARIVAYLKTTCRAGGDTKEVVSHRDLHQAFKKKPWARTSKDMENVMSDLEAFGYVRRDQRVAEGVRGGRPSVVWVVNPSILESTASWSQNPTQEPSEGVLGLDLDDP